MKSSSAGRAINAHAVHSSEEERVVRLLQEAEPLIVKDAVQARTLLHDVLAAAEALRFPSLQSHARCLLGAAAFFLNEFDVALIHFGAGLRLAREAANAALEARCVNGLGLASHKLGDYGAAMTHYVESLRLAQNSGDEPGRVRAMGNIGRVHADLGEYEQALELHLGAIDAARALGLAVYEAASSVNAAFEYHCLGRLEDSLRTSEAALQLVREHDLRQYEGELLTYRAVALLDGGDAAAAARLCEETLPLMERFGDREYMSYLLTVHGRALHELERHEEALGFLRRALALAQEIRVRVREAEAHRALSAALEACGDYRAALLHARAYHDLERAVHAENVDRRTKVLTVQVKVELLQKEAERERLRSEELTRANAALQEARTQLEHQALHDALTGLANRVHFERALQQTLHDAARDGSIHAVVFIDLDHFKHVNDTLGHDAGDELLKQVARRLRRAVRAHDLVARMGGDEFTLILRDLATVDDAAFVASKLLSSLRPAFRVAETELCVTASVGLALAPRDGTDLTTLQKRADIAMYCAKHAGKNTVRSFRDAARHG